MPFVENGNARIFWHETGKGSPVVLLMGLGCCSAMWFRMAPRIAKHHRVVMMDNRGVGRTQVSGATRTHWIRSMSGDVHAVLDDAGIDKAHLVGFWGC